jgi:two-component system, LytTR family, response regulator
VSALRIAIVDDEELARQVLREYLAGESGVEIVAECANGFEAVRAVTELKPDVVLLDVQMPKLDGFEVLELIGRDTIVVFTTAHDEYALRAFEVHAVDYLLKPFGPERLHEALGRVRQRRSTRPDATAPPPGLAAAARRPGAWLARVVIRDGPRVDVVPIDGIDFIEAQDDYVAVHTGDRTLLKDQTMTSLEAQLDPRRFVRIHRSYLLNLDRLARIEPEGRSGRTAVLRDGRRVPVSRSGYVRLQALL